MKKLDPSFSWPKPVSEEERARIVNYMEERFGIPREVFEPYEFLSTAKNYWILAKSSELSRLKALKVQTAGLLFMRKVSKHLKPTSAAVQRFGRFAKKNIVELDRFTLERLRVEKRIPFEAELEPGYVILVCEGRIWGCGLYLKGKLISYLP